MQTLDDCSLTGIALSSVIALVHPELRPIAAKMQFDSNLKAHIDVNAKEFDILLDRSQDLKRVLKTVTTLEEVEVFPQGSLASHTFYTRDERAMSEAQVKRKKAEHAVYRSLLATSPYLCAVHTPSGVIIDCNFTRERVGKDRDECVGQSAYEMFPDLAEIIYLNFEDAKKHPGRQIFRQFTMVVDGVPTKMESQTVLHSGRVYVNARQLDSFVYLSS